MGCLLRVATSRVCSPSPYPIGLRWTSQPRPSLAPGKNRDPTVVRISLMKQASPTVTIQSQDQLASFIIDRIDRRVCPHSFIGPFPVSPKRTIGFLGEPTELVRNRRGQKDRRDRGTSPQNR